MKTLRALLVAAFSTIASVAAVAADWPSHPVKIIVPFGAGGQSDIVARLIAQSLSETFKQQFYVENQGGGGGAIASKSVAGSEPDGHTLMITGMSTHVLAPALNKNI